MSTLEPEGEYLKEELAKVSLLQINPEDLPKYLKVAREMGVGVYSFQPGEVMDRAAGGDKTKVEEGKLGLKVFTHDIRKKEPFFSKVRELTDIKS